MIDGAGVSTNRTHVDRVWVAGLVHNVRGEVGLQRGGAGEERVDEVRLLRLLVRGRRPGPLAPSLPPRRPSLRRRHLTPAVCGMSASFDQAPPTDRSAVASHLPVALLVERLISQWPSLDPRRECG